MSAIDSINIDDELFWDWISKKEKYGLPEKDNKDRNRFEPLPLYKELEKPAVQNYDADENEDNSTSYNPANYDIDFMIYEL